MSSNVKNTSDLRQMLLDVIYDVRHQRIEASDAKAISALASQVLTSAKLDLEVMKSSTDSTKPITSTALVHDDGKIRSPVAGLSDEDYRQIKALKAAGKSLAIVSEKLKTVDKKLLGAAYYDKPLGGE